MEDVLSRSLFVKSSNRNVNILSVCSSCFVTVVAAMAFAMGCCAFGSVPSQYT